MEQTEIMRLLKELAEPGSSEERVMDVLGLFMEHTKRRLGGVKYFELRNAPNN